MPNFWGPKKDKKVINSSTKCLISVKIAILTPHIIPPPLVNVWLIFDLQKYKKCMSTDYVCFWKSIHAFKKHTSFVWIYSQLQIHTMLYVTLIINASKYCNTLKQNSFFPQTIYDWNILPEAIVLTKATTSEFNMFKE